MSLSDRKIKILRIIIEEYAKRNEPISSKYIAENFLKEYSSQTIRNEMAALEKEGYLEKTHTSSGRIPSVKAFTLYEERLNKNFTLDLSIQDKLKRVFQNRSEGIDTIINESLEIINEVVHLPLVVNSTSASEELISKVSAIQLDDFHGIIILVTSSGNINKSSFNIRNEQQFKDVEMCIDIFNKHLVKTPVSQIQESLFKIQEIIRLNVHEYEFVTREIVMRIFSMAHCYKNQKIVGISSIFQHPEFQDPEKIAKMIEMIEKGNIWKQLRYDREQDAVVQFNNSIPDSPFAIATTRITINNNEHQISVIGPDRMNYTPIKAILSFLKKEFEETFDVEKDGESKKE